MLLIDPPMWPAHGRRWSHLVSDVSFAELHAFATAAGLPVRGFEGDHYDVSEERYADVVAAGAVPVSSRELVRRLHACGLRRPKRRGERVVASRQRSADGGRGGRVDTLVSAMAPLGPVTAVHLLAARGREVLVLADGEGYELPSAAPGPGEPDVDVARRLLADHLGEAARASAPRRIGYLRHVALPPGRDALGGAARVESVLRAAALDSWRPARASWVDRTEAAALMSPELAPLVRLDR